MVIPGIGQFRGYALEVLQSIPIGFRVRFISSARMGLRGPNGEPQLVPPPAEVIFELEGDNLRVAPLGFGSFGCRGTDGEALTEVQFVEEAQRAVAMLLSGCRDREVEPDVTVLLSQCEVADTSLSCLKETIPEAELHFLIYRGIDVPTDPATPLTVRYHREQEIAFVSDKVGRVVALIGREATRTLFGE